MAQTAQRLDPAQPQLGAALTCESGCEEEFAAAVRVGGAGQFAQQEVAGVGGGGRETGREVEGGPVVVNGEQFAYRRACACRGGGGEQAAQFADQRMDAGCVGGTGVLEHRVGVRQRRSRCPG
ncbi:hypothetical protein [Streptomyces avermitilis]|uniref:hypothetical protein n=1 Tax=Streptomyces avermitilis TaxID=33903 RepID=UPI0033A74FBE